MHSLYVVLGVMQHFCGSISFALTIFKAPPLSPPPLPVNNSHSTVSFLCLRLTQGLKYLYKIQCSEMKGCIILFEHESFCLILSLITQISLQNMWFHSLWLYFIIYTHITWHIHTYITWHTHAHMYMTNVYMSNFLYLFISWWTLRLSL